VDDDRVTEQHVLAGALEAEPRGDRQRARIRRSDHRGDKGQRERLKAPAHAGARGLRRVPLTPGVPPQQPARLGLSKLRPVPQPHTAQQSAAGSVEYRQQTVTTLLPFPLAGPQTLPRLGPIECAHEPHHLRIAVQRDKLVEVARRKSSQHKPRGLDRHSRSVRLGSRRVPQVEPEGSASLRQAKPTRSARRAAAPMLSTVSPAPSDFARTPAAPQSEHPTGAREIWSAVDRYVEDHLIREDPALAAALTASAAAGLPAGSIAPNQGKLLELLVRIRRARRVLELGTLGGYSTIWLARGLPADGYLVTLERDPHYAEVARANIDRAGLAATVQIEVGPALRTLSELAAQSADPFDLVFLDADKRHNPEYLRWSLRLARPGTLIVADNVVRAGAILDPDAADPALGDGGLHGLRRFYELLAADPRLSATAIQTVGAKGHDGFALILVGDEGHPSGERGTHTVIR
jgi:predicted O-methyltransferase YrrM